MTRASIRSLLAGLAGALALCASVPAFAQSGTTITISGVACAQWTLGGAPPNVTLTCGAGGGGPGVPVCTISGSTTGVVGTATALVARCNPEATNGYLWTGGSCAGKTGITCMANEALTGPAVYTVRGTNAVGQGPVSPPFTVMWVAAPPPAPTGCVVQPYPPSGTLGIAGGPVGMTGSCSGGGTPTAWNWQKSGVAWGTNNPAQVDSLPANAGASPITYTYTLTACNGSSCASAISTTFTVAGTGGGGGISCSGFSSTIVVDAVWANTPVRYFTSAYGTGFHDGVAVVVRFTVPAGSPASSSVGTIGSDEYGDGPHYRNRALSTQSCDWTSAAVINQWWGFGGSQRFSVGISYGGFPVLIPGQTYYFNIKNEDPSGSPSCPVGASCNIGVDWSKPPGT